MSRAVSASARAALYAPQTVEAFLHLFTVTDHTLTTPLRLVDNPEDVTSNGDLFTAFPIKMVLPADVAGELPSIDVQIDAIDRSIIQIARAFTTPPQVSINIVMASTPDYIEAGPFRFDVTAIEYTATEVRFRLEVERLLSEPYPWGVMTPGLFPMLFQAVAA